MSCMPRGSLCWCGNQRATLQSVQPVQWFLLTALVWQAHISKQSLKNQCKIEQLQLWEPPDAHRPSHPHGSEGHQQQWRDRGTAADKMRDKLPSRFLKGK